MSTGTEIVRRDILDSGEFDFLSLLSARIPPPQPLREKGVGVLGTKALAVSGTVNSRRLDTNLLIVQSNGASSDSSVVITSNPSG